MFALVLVGWLFTAAAAVTAKPWLLGVAAPFLLLAGAAVLASSAAWSALARQATATGPFDDDYRQRVTASRHLRTGMGSALLFFGTSWLIAGLLL